jgi:hypothetical protein
LLHLKLLGLASELRAEDLRTALVDRLSHTLFPREVDQYAASQAEALDQFRFI